MNVKGTKTWIDNNNQDGKRPAKISITLYGDGRPMARASVSEHSGWTWNFENLPKYADDGHEIVYTIDEAAVEGYLTIVNGYDVTNVYEPESTQVEVVKIWDDMNDLDGSRPESIKVTLEGNGNPVQAVTLDESNNWSAAVSDLPLYENGQQIIYTWKESETKGYTAKVSAMGNITVITNTHVPELTKVSVKKNWNDGGNKLLRPASVKMELSNGMFVILNEANEWTATVENLPVTYKGEPIEYTWREEVVLLYTQTDCTVTEDGMTIFTNTPWRRPETTDDETEPIYPGPPTMEIDDYNTPLGLGWILNHVGDCFD